MAQDEALEFFKKNPIEWFTTRDISEAIGVNMGPARASLNGLLARKYIREESRVDKRRRHRQKQSFWRLK